MIVYPFLYVWLPPFGSMSGVLTEAQLEKLFPDGKIPGGVKTNAQELSERDSNGS